MSSLLARFLPGLVMLRGYDLAKLPRDLSAGIVLGAVMVPVGLAFGSLAGAPLAGLYAGMLPLIVYALFGSSRQLIVGPDASMAALVAASVAPLAVGDVGKLTLLAGTLAVLIGLILVGAGLLRLGFLADFLSKSVIVGFMHGLAVVIAVGQLPKVLGVSGPGETPVQQLIAIAKHIGEVNWYSLAIAAACIVIIQLCRRFVPSVPGQVAALAVAILAVIAFDLERRGVAIVGAIPTGLPHLQLPPFGLDDIKALLPIAGVAALVSFSDTMVTARGFASRNRYRVDADQELIAIGAGNLAAGLTQGLPISASGSRTAVAEASGSQTQVTSIVAAVTVGCAMLFLTGVLYFLPQAALGGILIVAAWNLCSFADFRRIWHYRGASLVGALLTFAGVLCFGIIEGIGLGIAFNLVQVLRQFAVPPDAILGEVAPGDFHDLSRHAEARPVPGIVVYRFSAPLFFLNCSFFRRRVEESVPAGTKTVVIEAGSIMAVDLAGAELLAEMQGELAARGTRLVLANMRSTVRAELERAWPESAGIEGLFAPSVGAAVTAAPRG